LKSRIPKATNVRLAAWNATSGIFTDNPLQEGIGAGPWLKQEIRLWVHIHFDFGGIIFLLELHEKKFAVLFFPYQVYSQFCCLGVATPLV